eukprot:6307178-Amphidinium_carterae.1
MPPTTLRHSSSPSAPASCRPASGSGQALNTSAQAILGQARRDLGLLADGSPKRTGSVAER